MANTDPELNLEELIREGKNKKNVFCVKCPSKIMCKGVGQYKEIEYSLPIIGPKKSSTEGEKNEEDIKEYWQVDNMYNFENIGYTNTVDGRKFLICADCELGPIGWQDLETKSSYLAVKRVLISNVYLDNVFQGENKIAELDSWVEEAFI